MKKILMMLITIACIFGLTELPVEAGEDTGGTQVTEMNQVMTVQEACDAKEQPDENAAVVMSYEAGSSAWVTGETLDGWYRVSYQGKEAYIPKASTTELQIQVDGESEEENENGESGSENKAPVTLAEAGIDTEMAALEAENELIVEEVERMRSEAKRSQIWKIVIVILVIGIFVVGIFSTVKTKKKKDGAQKDGKTVDPKNGADSVDVIDLDKDEE